MQDTNLIDVLEDTDEQAILPAIAMKIVARLQSGVVIVNSNRIIKYVNESACNIFGYHISELLNKNIGILLPESLASVHDEHIMNYVDNPRPRQMGTATMLLIGKRKDNSEIDVEIDLIPKMTVDGLLVAAIVTRKNKRK